MGRRGTGALVGRVDVEDLDPAGGPVVDEEVLGGAELDEDGGRGRRRRPRRGLRLLLLHDIVCRGAGCRQSQGTWVGWRGREDQRAGVGWVCWILGCGIARRGGDGRCGPAGFCRSGLTHEGLVERRLPFFIYISVSIGTTPRDRKHVTVIGSV